MYLVNLQGLSEPTGQVSGWSWWVYEVLRPEVQTAMTVSLRHNTAEVTEPLSFSDSSPSAIYTWLDWSG